MPYYNDLRPESDFKERDFALVFPDMSTRQKKRAIQGILDLKTALKSQISARRTEGNLLVASWNIKEFGHTKQRLPEAFFYIAEILSVFDLIAIQEIKSSTHDLQKIMRLLGSDWEYLVNDITSGGEGNSEQSAYVYNTKRVKLSGLVGELVLWPELTKDTEVKQLARTPYLTGFRAGWKSFSLLSVHLEPSDSDAQIKRRTEEVELLLAAIKSKTKESWSNRLVVVGDFNFYDGDDDHNVKAFEDAKFYEVDGLKGKDTNVSSSQIYDRIFIAEDRFFHVATDVDGKTIGGVFNPFEHVYKDGASAEYEQEIREDYKGPMDLEAYFQRYWKRNQISDHLPIWFELVTDDSEAFLQSRLKKHEA